MASAKVTGKYQLQHGEIELFNPHIKEMEEDVLYHLALGSKTHNLKEMFSDVKFVCFGGSANRMEKFAKYLVQELKIPMPTGMKLENVSHETDRYVLYKTGPVISVSHGMGVPSVSIVMHEIIKLVHHAGCRDIVFLRIGTCGGIGLNPGTVVITEEAVDGLFQPFLELAVLGEKVEMPASLDPALAEELRALAQGEEGFDTVVGKTMCTLGFYEGQARLDGAFCSYTEEDKASFLQRVRNHGIVNIEMESLCFAAYCHRAKISGAIICAVLVDRLKGDQVNASHDDMNSWSGRPQSLVVRFIKKRLGLS